VQALIAAGYVVFAINPMQVARYRERHSTSGAKSDAGDAHVLAGSGADGRALSALLRRDRGTVGLDGKVHSRRGALRNAPGREPALRRPPSSGRPFATP
jgi:hypothetical protein